jgi:hypothetical protein
MQKGTCDSSKLFRKPPVILRIVPKGAYDIYIGENLPIRERERRNINSGAAFGTMFRIKKCFHEASKTVYSNFSKQGSPHCKNNSLMFKKY